MLQEDKLDGADHYNFHEKMDFSVIRGNSPREDSMRVEVHSDNMVGVEVLGWDKAARIHKKESIE